LKINNTIALDDRSLSGFKIKF